MENKLFFRLSNVETEQGLWYDRKGNFTGLINNEFNFCKNSSLPMDYDEKVIGYLSSTDSIETLYGWFTKEDILRLQTHGFHIHEYEAQDYFFYKEFNHWLINQETSILTKRIILF